MAQYINKSALVAEIEKLKAYLQIPNAHLEAIKVCDNVISVIDTLELKEVDLENSMTCEVGWYDGFLLDYTQEQQDELLKKIGANVGDKIRIILVKE